MFDSEGNVSEQIDIIIYDALYAPLIFETDAGEKFVTAESVYAVFESKPDIRKKTLEYTNKKVKSVKVLKRTRRGVINAGNYYPPRELTHIIGGILAIDSVKKETIAEQMKLYDNIDIGCAIKSHSFLVDRKNNIKLSWASGEETVLAFFYMILDELYKLGTVAGIDIRSYANATLKHKLFDLEDK